MIHPPQVRPEEPTAVTPHGGFCGGKSQQWLRYPTDPHVRFGGGGSNPIGSPYPYHPSGARATGTWVPASAGTAVHVQGWVGRIGRWATSPIYA